MLSSLTRKLQIHHGGPLVALSPVGNLVTLRRLMVVLLILVIHSLLFIVALSLARAYARSARVTLARGERRWECTRRRWGVRGRTAVGSFLLLLTIISDARFSPSEQAERGGGRNQRTRIQLTLLRLNTRSSSRTRPPRRAPSTALRLPIWTPLTQPSKPRTMLPECAVSSR